MSNKRKVMIISGTRADYGLLRNIIKEVHESTELELQLVVTGSHLSTHNTVSEIENDGYPIACRVPILEEGSDQYAVVLATAKAMSGIGRYCKEKRPDIMVIIGDRYEMFAAATVALLENIPLAHIHGGELTLGAVDDALRHSMTKMSWWHFTSAEEYRNRVIKLGESPERVFNVGAPAVDSIDNLEFSKTDLEKHLGIELISPVLLATFHPETQNPGKAVEQLKTLIEGIKLSNPGTVIFTKANADAEGNDINNHLEAVFKNKEFKNSVLVSSLGQKRYLSLLKISDAGVGNSSSLVIEAPMLHTPSVNVGLRQEGRVRCLSIKDVPFDSFQISNAIKEAASTEFKNQIKEADHPFGKPGVAKKIVEILTTAELPETLIKGFYE